MFANQEQDITTKEDPEEVREISEEDKAKFREVKTTHSTYSLQGFHDVL